MGYIVRSRLTLSDFFYSASFSIIFSGIVELKRVAYMLSKLVRSVPLEWSVTELLSDILDPFWLNSFLSLNWDSLDL